MKKIVFFITAIFIFILLGAGGNVEDSALHKLKRTDWVVAQSGDDSTLFRVKGDSLFRIAAGDTLYIGNTNLVSSNGYLDIFPTTGVEIHDAGLNVSNGDIEAVNNTVKSDSVATDRINASSAIISTANVTSTLNVVTTLMQTETPQSGNKKFMISQDSVEITQNNLIFGNNAEIENDSLGALKLHADSLYLDGVTIIQGATTIDNIVKVNGNLTFENNAIIDNSAAGQWSITEDTIVLNGDSTYAVNVFSTDTAYVGTSRITNKEADSLKFDELNSVFKGNLKTTGLFSLTNGTTTTFTQALNRLTIAGGDSLSIRNMTNINPFRATSPQTSTYIGMGAGKVGCTGAGNVIMGYQAGSAFTSGYANTLIGSESGISIATGYRNTFVGYYSGRSTIGTRNTFIGSYSGRTNISGSYNTFVGDYSCYNSTAFYGVAVGDSSGFRNTIGSNNIFLGYKSGGNNTTGQRNMFLGDYRGYTSADSMLYIDNTGKDSTSTPLISGNQTAGVNNRSVTIDGFNYFKHIIGKFKRIDTFACALADTWTTIPIVVANGTGNTYHYSATTGTPADSCIVINRSQWNSVDATFKVYWGVNTSETVEFRMVKGAVSGGRTYSLCGQQKELVTKAIGDEKMFLLHSDGYFAQGDSLILQMRTSDTGIILKSLSDFVNPNSGTLNIKYLGDN